MIEYATEAIVLQKEPTQEFDAFYTLFTRDLGRLSVKAKSVRKPTSKLAAHLEPGLMTRVRLVGRGVGVARHAGFWVADSLSEERLFTDFDFLDFVAKNTLEFQSDAELWEFLAKGTPDRSVFLRLMGLGGGGPCGECGLRPPSFLHEANHVLLCEVCSRQFPSFLLLHI
jgi:hypothetical protein